MSPVYALDRFVLLSANTARVNVQKESTKRRVTLAKTEKSLYTTIATKYNANSRWSTKHAKWEEYVQCACFFVANKDNRSEMWSEMRYNTKEGSTILRKMENAKLPRVIARTCRMRESDCQNRADMHSRSDVRDRS